MKLTRAVRRLVAISGAGVLTPDDHVTMGRRFVRLLLELMAKHVAQAKEREYEILSATNLEWVLVRPPRIVPGAATGAYRVFPDRVPSPKISQGDVADFMLKCAKGDKWIRRAPIPGYQALRFTAANLSPRMRPDQGALEWHRQEAYLG